MPWKESSVMDERLRFVARLLDGEPMTQVCRDFGISRKAGYKIFDRYKEHDLEALTDRSRRPVRLANQLPPQLEARIVAIKRVKCHWGARKIRELLLRRLPGETSASPPRAPSTPFSIATGSSHRPAVHAAGQRERRCQTDLPQTNCGAPTSRESSNSATDAIAILSQLQITLRGTCCCARPSSPPARTFPLRHSSASFASAASPMPSAPTTAFPSPAQMRSNKQDARCKFCSTVQHSARTNPRKSHADRSWRSRFKSRARSHLYRTEIRVGR
jgi:transposase